MFALFAGSPALVFAIVAMMFAWTSNIHGEPFPQGLASCSDCHKDQFETWKGTKHFAAFRTAHKAKDAKKIAVAVGGKKNMKRNKNCVACHYSKEQKNAGARAQVRYGPACESCHGPSSDWEPIHLDYGGKSVKKSEETPAHKAKRIADSAAAGLAWAAMTYDIAANCMKCHGLARPDISSEAFAKMLGAGHPINQNFEMVMFFQGKITHSFKKPSPARLANMFIAGQAAKLVSATAAAATAGDVDYKAAQTKRANDARATLKVVPQAAALIASPSDDNARAMMQKIGPQDLSGLVGGMIPCAGPDKENLRQC